MQYSEVRIKKERNYAGHTGALQLTRVVGERELLVCVVCQYSMITMVDFFFASFLFVPRVRVEDKSSILTIHTSALQT